LTKILNQTTDRKGRIYSISFNDFPYWSENATGRLYHSSILSNSSRWV